MVMILIMVLNKTYPKHKHSNEYPNDNWEHILGTIR